MKRLAYLLVKSNKKTSGCGDRLASSFLLVEKMSDRGRYDLGREVSWVRVSIISSE